MALREIGDNSETLETATTWLINSRTMFASGINEGEWLIQLVSSVQGSCTLINDELQQNQTVNVEAGFTPWYTIPSAMLPQSTFALKVDCPSLTAAPSISLIQRKTVSGIVNYFIKEEIKSQKSVTMQLGIPCWGSTYRSTCDPEITSIVLFSLQKQNKSPDPSWLKQQSSLSPLNNAILYKLTSTQSYLTALESSQTPSGYFAAPDIFTTALIYSILPSSSVTTNKTYSWLLSQRDSSGCWPKPSNFCTIKSTASGLYFTAASPITTTTTIEPEPNQTSNKTILIDCDELCSNNVGCICPQKCKLSSIAQGETCQGEEEKPVSTNTPCITEESCDGIYDSFNRCIDVPEDGCPKSDKPLDLKCNKDSVCDISEDCACSDCRYKACTADNGKAGTCDYYSGECKAMDQTTEIKPPTTTASKTSSTFLWLGILIPLLGALGAGIYFAYKKGLIKFKKSPAAKSSQRFPSYEPKTHEPYQPRMKPSTKSPVKKFLNNELDKSIEELERLLKG